MQGALLGFYIAEGQTSCLEGSEGLRMQFVRKEGGASPTEGKRLWSHSCLNAGVPDCTGQISASSSSCCPALPADPVPCVSMQHVLFGPRASPQPQPPAAALPQRVKMKFQQSTCLSWVAGWLLAEWGTILAHLWLTGRVSSGARAVLGNSHILGPLE